MHQKALSKAIKIAGSQVELARRLGIDPRRVNNWLNRDKTIPLTYALAIQAITKGQVKYSELTTEKFSDHVNPPSTYEIYDRLSRLEVRIADIEELLLVNCKGKL